MRPNLNLGTQACCSRLGFIAQVDRGQQIIKAILLFVLCGLLRLAHAQAAQSANSSSENDATNKVTLYQVPWRCPAAPQIGCGSHAKPILLRLENYPGVSEAWLNRQGTVLAVIWKADLDSKTRRSIARVLN